MVASVLGTIGTEERMARVAMDSAYQQAEAQEENSTPSSPTLPTLRSLGCAMRRVRRYNPDHGRSVRGEGSSEASPAAKESVPVCGAQLLGGGDLSISDVANAMKKKDERPAWDSSWTKGAAGGIAGGCMHDVSAVRVCGVNAVSPLGVPSTQSAASPPTDTDPDTSSSPLRRFVAGAACGGRMRDLAASAAPMRPMAREGEAEKATTRSVLHKLLDMQGAGGGDGKGLIKRFEPGGGRLFISDRPRAMSKKWLEANGILTGRAVRCLRPGKGDEYPAMRSTFYEVDDVLNEPILGYHIEGEGCLLEVAGVRRIQIKQVLDYIHQGIQCGESVLVHCRMGTNRSVVVACAYMMIYHGFTCEDALRLIEMRGPSDRAVRQPGFTEQLLKLEQELIVSRMTIDVRKWQDLPDSWGDLMFQVPPAQTSDGAGKVLAETLQGKCAYLMDKLRLQKETVLASGPGHTITGTPLSSHSSPQGSDETQTDMAANMSNISPIPALELLADGHARGISHMVEVLEGSIWHSKLMSLERREGSKRVLCIAPPPQSTQDTTVLNLCVSLRGASFEAINEREMSVRIPGRTMLSVTSRSAEERDEFVRVGVNMAAMCDCEDDLDGLLLHDEEVWAEGTFAKRAQLVTNEEDEDVEVWM